jgi:alpha-glucosidase
MALVLDVVQPTEHDPIPLSALEENPTTLFTPLHPFESLEAGAAFKATVQNVEGTMFYPARLTSQKAAKAEEVPFFHFLSSPQIVDGAANPKLAPLFCDTQTTFGIEIPATKGSNWYGGGEQARSLCLNNSQFITWNTDAFAYNQGTPSLYQSHPFLMLLQEDGSAHGIIANSTYPLHFEMTDSHLKIVSHANPPVPFSLFLYEGPTPQEITSKLATMTGFMQMPPKWSLGYHQCRWSYYPDSVAVDIAKSFRQNNIPCDVIWFDIHYMNGYRVFTFDDKIFPDPKKLNDDLHELGFNTFG